MSDTLKFTPALDRILIRRAPAEEKTPGGIVIPATATKTDQVEGEILAVGPGRWEVVGDARLLRTPNVMVGDVIVTSKHAGHKIKVNGEELVVIVEDEILGFVRKV